MPLGRPADLKARSITITSDPTASLGLPGLSAATTGKIMTSYTTVDRTNLTNVLDGAVVYDTDLGQFWGYANGGWVAMS